MRIVLIAVFLLCLLWAVSKLFIQQPPAPTTQSHGLPWQVEQLTDGSTRVFNLRPGLDTLAKAREELGSNYQFGIIAKDGESGALELFYNNFQTGRLSGKLILVADISKEELTALRSEADKREVLSNGSSIYTFTPEQEAPLWLKRFKHIHYAPTVRLQEGMVKSLFGEPEVPASKLENSVTLYSYPQRGMSIFVDDEGKDAIIYQLPSQSAP